jgi:hypothetical protein
MANHAEFIGKSVVSDQRGGYPLWNDAADLAGLGR